MSAENAMTQHFPDMDIGNYMVVGADDFVEEGEEIEVEEDWEIPLWIVMLGMFFIATSLCALIFYASYRHERRAERPKSASSQPPRALDDQLEEGLKKSVKVSCKDVLGAVCVAFLL